MVSQREAYLHETQLDRGGRSAWGAIFAGVFVGLAIFAVLSLLGLGIGLTAIEIDENDVMGSVPTASPIWLFVSQVIALGIGGFVAGRLAGVLHGVGSMLHGATVWALSTLAAAWLTISAGIGVFNMAGSALSLAGSTVSQAVSATGSAVGSAIPDDVNLPDLAISQIGLEDLPEPIATRLREAGITPQNFREETREAFRSVISRAEQQRAFRAVSSTALEILRNPTNARTELQNLADTLIGGEDAVLSEEDRQEALRVMQRRLGMTPQEAEAYVDQIQARMEELRAEFQTAIDESQQQLDEFQASAIEAADQAADRAAKAALLAALAALVGLGAAVFGAYVGRPINID